MSVRSYFSETYADARAKFVAACAAAELQVESHRHPLAGPDDGPLFVDVVRAGPADATKLLLTVSATHGVEGFCGSGCQIGWLREGLWRALPDKVGMLIVHAINPYGFAWLRRVNEDNVDLNRNFVDHDAPPANNPGYRELADTLCPAEWDEASAKLTRIASQAFIDRHGDRAFVTAVSSGQFSHPEGIFYGGRAPVWSNRLMHEICMREMANVRQLAVIDFHTGLGPYGYGELICRHPSDSEALARARRWYGDSVTSPSMGQSASPVIDGNLRMAFVGWLPDAQVTSTAIEYGTYPEDRVFDAIRADNWLHLHGDLTTPKGRAIKAEMREMFYPAADDWKDMVWERAVQVQRQALRGLAGS